MLFLSQCPSGLTPEGCNGCIMQLKWMFISSYPIHEFLSTLWCCLLGEIGDNQGGDSNTYSLKNAWKSHWLLGKEKHRFCRVQLKVFVICPVYLACQVQIMDWFMIRSLEELGFSWERKCSPKSKVHCSCCLSCWVVNNLKWISLSPNLWLVMVNAIRDVMRLLLCFV